MRARNLKPSFFLNEDLAALPMAARLLFQGLWCMADREGRLEDRPLRIKATILPYDDANADALLTLLHDGGFILRYHVGDARYIQVLNFGKHQNPHIKEGASTIPAPDTHGASTVLAPDEHGSGPADSLLLIPESPLLDTAPVRAREKAVANAPPPRPVKAGQPPERDETWDAFDELFGEPSNTDERGRRNKAVKLAKESRAGPDELKQLHQHVTTVMWPNLTVKDITLATNITDIRQDMTKRNGSKPHAANRVSDEQVAAVWQEFGIIDAASDRQRRAAS